MKNALGLLKLGLLASFLLAAQATLNYAHATTILMFGDSLLSGYKLQPGESVPDRVQALLSEKGYQVSIVNGGVPGNTTGDGLARLPSMLRQYRPEVVFLGLGANDGLRSLPIEVTRTNLDAMLSMLQQYGGLTIFSAVYFPEGFRNLYRPEFNALYPELARKYGLPLYPFLLDGVYGYPEMMLPDGIHPSAKGADLIAKRIAYYLATQVLNR